MRQQKFAGFKNSKPYGGDLRKKANDRGARPITTKKAMHLVLRSTQATGEQSFRKNYWLIDGILKSITKKYGVKLYNYTNSGNHLHLVIKVTNRYVYAAFIRALTGTIAIKITKANKFKALKKRFWDYRPFTRIIEWGKAYRLMKDYLQLNELEASGIFPYQKSRLRGVDLHPPWSRT